MKQMKVEVISHEWNVLQKKKFGKVTFYLLTDVRFNEKGQKIQKGIFKVIKESKDAMEHFTGRIASIEDFEETFDSMRDVIKGRSIIQQAEKVPYIHKLWDMGACTTEEAQEMFGEEYEPIRIVNENNPEEYEVLLYKEIKPVEKEKQPPPKTKTK